MPKLVGGLAALIALAAGILSHVEPYTCLIRGLLAFLLGWAVTNVWYVFFTIRVQPVEHPPRKHHAHSEGEPTVTS